MVEETEYVIASTNDGTETLMTTKKNWINPKFFKSSGGVELKIKHEFKALSWESAKVEYRKWLDSRKN